MSFITYITTNLLSRFDSTNIIFKLHRGQFEPFGDGDIV